MMSSDGWITRLCRNGQVLRRRQRVFEELDAERPSPLRCHNSLVRFSCDGLGSRFENPGSYGIRNASNLHLNPRACG